MLYTNHDRRQQAVKAIHMQKIILRESNRSLVGINTPQLDQVSKTKVKKRYH